MQMLLVQRWVFWRLKSIPALKGLNIYSNVWSQIQQIWVIYTHWKYVWYQMKQMWVIYTHLKYVW